MVDRVKFFVYNVGVEILEQKGWRPFKAKTNEFKITYSKALHNSNALFPNNFKLLLLLEFNRATKEYNLIVRGSLRKWFFGKNVRRDLKKIEFKKSLIYLSRELQIPLKEILNGNITQIELGTTLVLNAEYRKILTGLVAYPKLPRKEYRETLYFGDKFKEYKKRSSYHFIFYDKLKEIHKEDKQKLKQIEHLQDKIYFCRFEISLNKLSQVTKFKNEVKSFQQILDNWEGVQIKIIEHFDKIVYVDYMSDFKMPARITNATKRKWEKYNEIQDKTLPVILDKIDDNKSNRQKQLIKFLEKNSEGDYSNLKIHFKGKLEEKLQLLSNNQP